MHNDFYQEIADKFIFTVKKGLLYTENDVWIEIKNGKAKIGITDFFQRRLGDAVFVELPSVGYVVKQNEPYGAVESIKAVIDLVAPLNGTVKEVNEKLRDNPEHLNNDPYGEGWLVRISSSKLKDDKSHLISAEKYFELMKSKIKDELKKSKKEA
ncbi:glycine cleavage system protein GcvH [Candidatus Bathyarchaeota archaeon]|nr:glycine cleavage system protein GcvH [Candidatus Bathyarchaeota archaeon]